MSISSFPRFSGGIAPLVLQSSGFGQRTDPLSFLKIISNLITNRTKQRKEDIIEICYPNKLILKSAN